MESKQIYISNQPKLELAHQKKLEADKINSSYLQKVLIKASEQKEPINELKRNCHNEHQPNLEKKQTQQSESLKRQRIEDNIEKKQIKISNDSIVFRISSDYEFIKIIGSGVYGIVALCRKKSTNESVAIKKISKLFNSFGDTRRVLRQIKILEFLNHKNIISLKSIQSIDDPQQFNQIYLCMQYMQFDLRRLIQSKTPITQSMTKYIMYQLLVAINFMHSADILHRDLKPQNILMNKKCELKIADMNLARKQTYIGTITDYVASRPYRAPEILIGSTRYTKSVDIWSIGCIFAQLLGKTIIFQGKDFIDQLKRFVAILGKPKIQYFPNIDKTSMQSLGKLISQIQDKQKVSWQYLMPHISDKAADLLDHMLTYDANARYTAEQCLNHPFMDEYRKAPRVKCDKIFDFSFDKTQLKQKSLRQAICQTVKDFQMKKAMESEGGDGQVYKKVKQI